MNGLKRTVNAALLLRLSWFVKPSPQLGRLLTVEDVRRMARMEANEQIAGKFGYRVHSHSSVESAALNQQTIVAPNDFLGS